MRTLVLLAAVVLIAGCDSRTASDHAALRRWLLCDECTHGELDSIFAMGERPLDALQDVLLRGPPSAGRQNIRMQAEGMYDRAEPGGIRRAEYVDGIVENYVASYQRRAARAVDTIGTPRARAIILDALQRDPGYREDVRRTLGEALGVKVSTVAGDSQHAALGSFVLVNPTLLIEDLVNGQGLRGIPVRFKVDSGRGQVFDTLGRTAADGRAVVRWRIGLQDTINVLRARAAGRTVRFRAIGHPPGLRLIFLVQPSSGLANQPFTSPVRIAVQDAFGRTATNLNQPSGVVISVVGTGIDTALAVVAGVAELPRLPFVPVMAFGGPGLRLRAVRPGTASAISEPFDLKP